MNKLIRLTVIIAILSLTSFKSFSQTWGGVVSTSIYNGITPTPGGSVLQLNNSNGTAYTQTYQGATFYYFVFTSGGVNTYYVAAQLTSGVTYSSYTQAQYNEGGFPKPIGVPLDGGVSLLLVGGVALHIRRKKQLAINSEAA